MKKLILLLSATLALSCGQVVKAEDTVNTGIVSEVNTDSEMVVPETEENESAEEEIITEEESTDENDSSEDNESIEEVEETLPLENIENNIEEVELVENADVHKDGWVYEKGEYYFYKDEKMVTGWLKWNNNWYYLDGSNLKTRGVMLHNERKLIGGKMYYFAESGAMKTGWVRFENQWYYTDANGAGKTGWFQENNIWYYLDGSDDVNPGRMLSGEKAKIGSSYYIFASNGTMQTGWNKSNGKWHYCYKGGNMKTGWLQDNNIWYYLKPGDDDTVGEMAANEMLTISGSTYRFNSSGVMQTGWCWTSEGYYYFKQSGQQVTGWTQWNKHWYYLDSKNKGIMSNGKWQFINGRYYYFDVSGIMKTGWLSYGGNWYYLNNDGSMASGWNNIDNKRYYFYCQNDKNGGVWGAMAKNIVIDGVEINASGVCKLTIFQNNSASDILAIAKMGLGKPYVWGGATPSGWDCSGYVTWVAKQLGVNIGRCTDDIARICVDKCVASGASVSQFHMQYDTGVIQPGDIVVFSTSYGTTVHTGIIGENKSLYHAWYPGVGTVKSDFAYVLTVDASSYQTYKIYRGAGL